MTAPGSTRSSRAGTGSAPATSSPTRTRGCSPPTSTTSSATRPAPRSATAPSLASLASFFGERMPLLGSVKGNIGHLLTVAGITSLIKVVLALRSGTIPATVGGDASAPLLHDRVVERPTAWPDVAGRPRRAAVSAFGFGGANAHVVLSHAPGGESAPTPDPAPRPAARTTLAVTGVGAYVGAGARIDDLLRVEGTGDRAPLLDADTTARSTRAPRDGAPLGPIALEPMADRIPPTDVRHMNPAPSRSPARCATRSRTPADRPLPARGPPSSSPWTSRPGPTSGSRTCTRTRCSAASSTPRSPAPGRPPPPPSSATPSTRGSAPTRSSAGSGASRRRGSARRGTSPGPPSPSRPARSACSGRSRRRSCSSRTRRSTRSSSPASTSP
ncbi:ketoacyl-synthetase C-terminal extension domain-containing protein [Clavibacter tessellarius]